MHRQSPLYIFAALNINIFYQHNVFLLLHQFHGLNLRGCLHLQYVQP